MQTTGWIDGPSRSDDGFMKQLLLTAVILLITTFVPERFAQEHTGHQPAPTIPIELLQRPVTLRKGIGAVHEAVSTKSRDAQAFYDQGLAYLHSYVWIEAARSFNQALRSDPQLAMAYVGLSRAFSGLGVSGAAQAVLDQGLTFEAQANPRERRRIALRARQLHAMADPTNTMKLEDYRRALDDALVIDSSDVELWLLRGNAEEATAGGRGQHGAATAIPFYEKALKLAPDHFGAHHYLIHCYENTGQIPAALEHAEFYVRAAPAIPHAHHMYGHDLRRVGKIEDAIAEFQKADQLEEEYYRTENIPAQFDWHHEHNLDLLATCYQYQGRIKLAEQLMKKSFSIPSMQDTLEFNKKQLPAFLLVRGRAEDALAAARVLGDSRWEIVRSIGHVMASRALLGLNRAQEASEEAKLALKEVQGSAQRTQFLSPYLEALQGEFFLRTGQAERGRSVLKEVQRKLRLEKGPDEWVQALFTLEGIARMAREAGDWELADYTARQMIEHDPNYAGAHFAMALVAEHNKNSGTALKEFTLAEKYWQQADSDLPEIGLVKARLASSPSGVR
jgi:tetratricopeptide (TPR) repeat protein